MRGSGLRGPFGYPILVASYGAGQNLAFRSCSVVGPGGKAVECVVKHPGNDLESRDCVIIIPKAPLTAKSSYKVTAAFTVGGVDRSESWSFRTGSE